MTVLVIPTDATPVIGPPQGHWTLADWETLSHDWYRYEVINGVLYESDVPSVFHQWIVQQLYHLIGISAGKCKMAYVGMCRVSVVMPGCEPVQPDFVLVLKERTAIIRRYIIGVPDLIVEVLSPGSTAYDEQVKLLAYAAAGVPEYGIIDPAARAIKIYRLEAPDRYAGPHTFEEGQSFAFNCLPGISAPVGELFAGAPDTTL